MADVMMTGMSSSKDSVVFFDGLCVLCNGTIALLIRIDQGRKLRYSSLQGKFAQTVLNAQQIHSNESIILWSDGIFREKADAVIHILIKLGGMRKFMGMLLAMFPLSLLNALYDWVARNRYRFFGKNDACLVPTDDVKDLFIP